MKNLVKVVGIIAFVVVIGFSMAACDDGNKDDGGDANTLIITSYPGEMEAGDVHFIALVPVDTIWSNIQVAIIAAASADIEDAIGGVSISGTTATIKLKSPDANWENFTNWAGSGTYDVWIAPKGTDTGSSWYKASSVSFTEAETTIPASSFTFQLVQ